MITDRAIRIVAEDKIQAAIREGLFDNFPGFGKPSPLCDEPYDPNSWIRRKLKDEKVIAARVHEWTLIREGKDVAKGMIEYYKQYVDREKLRANLTLTVEQRFAQYRDSQVRALPTEPT